MDEVGARATGKDGVVSEDGTEALDVGSAFVPPLLDALEALRDAGRRLNPPELPAIVAAAGPRCALLIDAAARLEGMVWPPSLQPFASSLRAAAAATIQSHERLAASLTELDPTRSAYGALRGSSRALEALYPASAASRAVSEFFLCADQRQDATLIAKIARAHPGSTAVGMIHVHNDRDARGGYSLYVPEYYDATTAWPLVVGLHGGSGNGRDFLWSWLREVRGAGALLLSPTAQGRTWSLDDPRVDGASLSAMIEQIAARWRVDRSRVLLSGMSDGGSFTLLAGLLETVPATHLAPIAASFHPAMIDRARAERLAGLPIYLTHGVQDWMFPVARTRVAAQALRRAGAALEYREIPDLSHTYPVEEGARIRDWFLGSRT